LNRALCLVVVLAATGCTSVNEAYTCTSASSCVFQGAAGVCEPNGACSFPDAACSSGRRYGELSAEGVAGVCVGSEGITDEDGDQIDDTIDNCVDVANPTQHDEDGDERGDACDPCPPYADGPVIEDPDGDGVSGACDPEPGVANRIVEFHGFDTGKPFAFTVHGMGTWTYANDEARVDASAGALGMLLVTSPGTASTISTALTIEAIDATGTRVAGVVDLFDVAASRGTSCVAIRDPLGGQSLLLSDTLTGDNYGEAPLSVTAGLTATIVSRRDAAMMTCSTTSLAVSGTALFNPSDVRTGIRARGATVRFGWVMLVGR